MTYRIDPKKQFSKWLARWTAVFWFLYMSWLSAVMLIVPATGLYCVYMGIVVTVVMILNVYSYCKNSIAEKMIFGIIDKTKIEMRFGNSKASTESDNDSEMGDSDDQEG